MKKIFLLSLLLMAMPSYAVICKTIDAQGNVAYSDVPAKDCQIKIKLPEVTTYKPEPIATSNDNSEAKKAVDENQAYTTLIISSPASGATVRDNSGKVNVVVDSPVSLKKGDKLLLSIDGEEIDPPFPSLKVTLTGVQKGSHSLEAKIIDAKGEALVSASSVTFTLRQDSLFGVGGEKNPDVIKEKAAQAEKQAVEDAAQKIIDDKAAKDAAEAAIEAAKKRAEAVNAGLNSSRSESRDSVVESAFSPNFTPSEAAKFKPNAAPAAPSAPGTTNSAFAPKFNP